MTLHVHIVLDHPSGRLLSYTSFSRFFHPVDSPDVLSNGITRAISLQNVPWWDAEAPCLVWKHNPRRNIRFTGDNIRIHEDSSRDDTFQSVIFSTKCSTTPLSAAKHWEKPKKSETPPSSLPFFCSSLFTAMGLMAPSQFMLWKDRWLVWCQCQPAPTLPPPTPYWTWTRTPTCLLEESSAQSRCVVCVPVCVSLPSALGTCP